MTLLEFQDVFYQNEEKTILKDISFSIDSQDFISVVGASGSGKSTLLKLCCHLISPSSGNIIFKGNDFLNYNPVELRKTIAYCFQTPHLFGDTVMENIHFPFNVRHKKFDPKRVNDLFTLFQMSTEFLDKDTKKLSGGEKQRIALIRSLLFKPEILLLDEATSALDEQNTRIVEGVIHSLHQEGITVLWITHNLQQSRKFANKLLTIESGEIKSLEVLK